MRRREFIWGAVMLGWPAASYAQTASHVIGFVNSASAEGYSSMADAFKEGRRLAIAKERTSALSIVGLITVTTAFQAS